MIINDVNTMLMMKTSPLPTGYTLLNWIENTSRSWIDTGVKPNGDTRTSITFALTSLSDNNNNVLCGTQNLVNGRQAYLLFNNVPSGVSSVRFSDTNVLRWSGFSIADTNKHNITLKNSNELYVDDTLIPVSDSSSPLTIQINYTMYIFNRNSVGDIYPTTGNGKLMKLYDFKLWNSNGNLCHLIPAKRDSDSVVGMYDIVQNVFRTNQGTGTFTYG